jgi:hypothetical protein
MRDMIRRTFHAVSASTALFLAAMSAWLVLTTRGISTMDGLFLMMTSTAGLLGLVVHGLQALEENGYPLSIRPESWVRSFQGLESRRAGQTQSQGA